MVIMAREFGVVGPDRAIKWLGYWEWEKIIVNNLPYADYMVVWGCW